MLGTIFGVVIIVLSVLTIIGSMMDDEDKKAGRQPRRYYSGKAGTRYKAPGDRESTLLGWIFIVIIIFSILAAVLGG